MWTFAGLVFVGTVLWYYLRKIFRSLQTIGAVIEATVNRAAEIRGDAPVSDDIDTTRIF